MTTGICTLYVYKNAVLAFIPIHTVTLTFTHVFLVNEAPLPLPSKILLTISQNRAVGGEEEDCFTHVVCVSAFNYLLQ